MKRPTLEDLFKNEEYTKDFVAAVMNRSQRRNTLNSVTVITLLAILEELKEIKERLDLGGVKEKIEEKAMIRKKNKESLEADRGCPMGRTFGEYDFNADDCKKCLKEDFEACKKKTEEKQE